MSTVLLWALGLVGSWVAGRLAETFAGACPFLPTDWVCAHWGTIAEVGGGILAMLGYGAVRSRVAARSDGLKLVPPPPPEEPTPVQKFDPGAIGDANPHEGP